MKMFLLEVPSGNLLQFAIENGDYDVDLPMKRMVIFHSYVGFFWRYMEVLPNSLGGSWWCFFFFSDGDGDADGSTLMGLSVDVVQSTSSTIVLPTPGIKHGWLDNMEMIVPSKVKTFVYI